MAWKYLCLSLLPLDIWVILENISEAHILPWYFYSGIFDNPLQTMIHYSVSKEEIAKD